MRAKRIIGLAMAALVVGWLLVPVRVYGEGYGAVDEGSLFLEATGPAAGVALIPEWEPVEAVVVSLPLEGVFARAGMGEFMLALLTSSARYSDVVVLHDEEELQTVGRVLAGVRDLDAGLLERIHFVPARVGTVWLRDHGPVFGLDESGGLVVLDSVYRDARFEARVEQERAARGGNTPEYRQMAWDLAKRRKDDTTPVYVAQYLRQMHDGAAVRLVRPPAQVWGGDIVADDEGNVFVSTETLTMHGGKRAELDALLRDYYGAESVTYLEPLPGATVKHLDMFFKVAADGTIFLASYEVDEDALEVAGEYGGYLHGEVKRVLARNESRLRKAFPGRAIVRLPMPAVVMPTEAEVVREYRDLWYTQKLLMETPALREALSRAGDPNDRAEIEMKVTARAVAQYSQQYKAEPGSDAERDLVDKLIRENSSTNLDEAIRHYAPNPVIYKTFLNSVDVDGRYGKAVLVPDYAADALNDEAQMQAMRDRVRGAYEAATPGVEVVFINCDTVIGLSGALHCVTVTVPRVDR